MGRDVAQVHVVQDVHTARGGAHGEVIPCRFRGSVPAQIGAYRDIRCAVHGCGKCCAARRSEERFGRKAFFGTARGVSY